MGGAATVLYRFVALRVFGRIADVANDISTHLCKRQQIMM